MTNIQLPDTSVRVTRRIDVTVIGYLWMGGVGEKRVKDYVPSDEKLATVLARICRDGDFDGGGAIYPENAWLTVSRAYGSFPRQLVITRTRYLQFKGEAARFKAGERLVGEYERAIAVEVAEEGFNG